MHRSRSYCQAEFRSALLPSICQLAADDNAFPWFVPSLTLSLAGFIPPAQSLSLSLASHHSLLPLHLHGHPFSSSPRYRALSFPSSIAFTLLFLRMAMCALRSGVMVSLLNYHQLQISFYFGKVLIYTHARHEDRARQDEMKFVRLFVARDRSVRCRKVFRRLKAATGVK